MVNSRPKLCWSSFRRRRVSSIGKSLPGPLDIGEVLFSATARCPGLCKLGVMTTPVIPILDFFNLVKSHLGKIRCLALSVGLVKTSRELFDFFELMHQLVDLGH